jgi:PEP-CTERM motif
MSRLCAIGLGFGLALVAVAAPAFAGPVISSLDVISASAIGSGALGTVILTQNGADEVDVSVTLASDTYFVNSGGPHNAFTFNLDVSTPYSVNITSPTGGVFSVAGSGATNTPYGSFSNGIECPGCGPGASHKNPGPLDFSVTDADGISVSDFVTDGSGYYFSADVLGPNGGTGNIAANAAADPPSIPEPSAVLLFGAGLLGLGAVRFRVAKCKGLPRGVPGSSNS